MKHLASVGEFESENSSTEIAADLNVQSFRRLSSIKEQSLNSSNSTIDISPISRKLFMSRVRFSETSVQPQRNAQTRFRRDTSALRR